jgi:hypothetical protein
LDKSSTHIVVTFKKKKKLLVLRRPTSSIVPKSKPTALVSTYVTILSNVGAKPRSARRPRVKVAPIMAARTQSTASVATSESVSNIIKADSHS